MEEKINLQHVVESLAEQKKAADISNAYKDALLMSKDERIKELEEELDQLRKEHIKQMDEEAK